MPVSHSDQGDESREVERVRAAYARREQEQRDARYALTSPENLYLFQRRERELVRLLRQEALLPLAGRRILDVGCGDGNVLRDLERYGAEARRLAGVDLLTSRVASAVERSPEMAFALASGTSLPFADGAFDAVLLFTVLSSVLDDASRRAIGQEALRVIRPGGSIVLYDFVWNPLNRDVRGLGPSEAKRLFGGAEVTYRRMTLAPPIARRVVRLSWTASRLLEAVPLLRSHVLVHVRKPELPAA